MTEVSGQKSEISKSNMLGFRCEAQLARSRKYAERLSLIKPVRGESATIQGKNQVRLQLFAQGNQSRVGEIHGNAAVPFHQNRDPLQALSRRREQLNGPTQEKLQRIFPTFPHRPHQVEGFGQHSFRRHDGSGPFFESRDAVIVPAARADRVIKQQGARSRD